jgi:DNA repair exonuclease SbcCD nuclease subunit
MPSEPTKISQRPLFDLDERKSSDDRPNQRDVCFIHTADWQLGKPYAKVRDDEKRSLLSQQRLQAVTRLKNFITENNVNFVVVAGDLFDTQTPKKQLVSAACKAIGDLQVPVYAIPGNHDFYGIESIWEQDFFKQEQKQLAPNFHLITTPTPIEAPGAWLFPAPLLRRHASLDPTHWLRTFSYDNFLAENPLAEKLPWIVLAHGTIQGFESNIDDEEIENSTANLLDLDRLPKCFDYVALGDWHGMKQINDIAWYSGTHEPDRFPKNSDYRSGLSLLVRTSRQQTSIVEPIQTGELKWHCIDFHFHDDDSLSTLENEIQKCTSGRVGNDLLRLELTGSLGLAAAQRLESLIETWESRFLRVKNYSHIQIAPTEQELLSLTQRNDPLIARVAQTLNELRTTNSEQASIANVALRQLFQLCQAVN